MSLVGIVKPTSSKKEADDHFPFCGHQKIGRVRDLNLIVKKWRKKMELTQREISVIQKVINKILDSAKSVFQDLGEGWPEAVYQKAMEVELRERGIKYEEQRVLPVYYKDKYLVGRAELDLIVLVNLWSGKRVHIVIELKTDTGIKEDHKIQIQKYIKALKKSLLSENDIVYPVGLIINFIKPSSIRLYEGIMQANDSMIQWLEVEVEEDENDEQI